MEEDIFEETVTVPLGQTVSVTGGRKVGRWGGFSFDELYFQYKWGAREILNSFIKYFLSVGLGAWDLGYRIER